jgi:outer membrane autotransporter protein
MSGSLVSVLDVNFLDRTSDAASEAFISNLIQYLDTQAEIGEQPLSIFVPVSNGITNGVAQTLDGLLLDSIIDVDMAAAVGELSSLSDAQRATAMNRLTPDASNAQLQLGYQATSAGLSNIETRLDGIRNAGALARGKQNYENVRVASAGSLKGVLEAKELKHGAWGKFFGGEMSQDAQDGYAGYSANTWGLTFGLDTRLSQGTTVGIALAYSDSDLDNEDFLNGSQNDMEHEQITGYFDHDFGPWYLDGFLSYALLNYSSVRDTGVTGIASGDYDGDIFAVKVDAGIPFALSATVAVTPFASLEYDHLSVDGYTETGAGPLNLTVNENSADRLRSGLGIRLSNDMEFKGMHVRPSLHVQWLHNFENDGIATTAGFEGGGAEFTTPGQDIEENTGNIGANLLFTVGKNSALSVRYDYEAGGEFESHSGQLVYQLWF